jgi:hypothetical protein
VCVGLVLRRKILPENSERLSCPHENLGRCGATSKSKKADVRSSESRRRTATTQTA